MAGFRNDCRGLTSGGNRESQHDGGVYLLLSTFGPERDRGIDHQHSRLGPLVDSEGASGVVTCLRQQ
jgi:hypothetical protein